MMFFWAPPPPIPRRPLPPPPVLLFSPLNPDSHDACLGAQQTRHPKVLLLGSFIGIFIFIKKKDTPTVQMYNQTQNVTAAIRSTSDFRQQSDINCTLRPIWQLRLPASSYKWYLKIRGFTEPRLPLNQSVALASGKRKRRVALAHLVAATS